MIEKLEAACVRLCSFVCFHVSMRVFICVRVCLSDREQGLGPSSDRGGVKKVSKIHFFSSGTEGEEGRPVRYFSWL